MKRLLCCACCFFIIIGVLSGCSLNKKTEIKLTDYKNEKGIGIFYPQPGQKISGIAKVYGLAYIDEGWLEDSKGVGKVTVKLGNKKQSDARTYVKDRYWVRTFDTTQFKDGTMDIKVSAYDKKNNLIGTVTNSVIIDNSDSNVQKEYFVSPDGLSANKGSKGSPWDLQTGITRIKAGDVLFLRGGVYNKNILINKSGEENKPITIMNYQGEKVQLKGAGIDVADTQKYINILGIDQSGLRKDDYGVALGSGVEHIEFWDCSFMDNTHPYDAQIQGSTTQYFGYGTGFYAGNVSSALKQCNRKYITVSHCKAMYNDADGFDFSSIDHGRYQYLESAWNPKKNASYTVETLHANGFSCYGGETAPELGIMPAEDNIYLFCLSHHNSHDGFDLRTPYTHLFGCITHDEGQGNDGYGGSGIKFMNSNEEIYNCVNFNNNIVDYTGNGMGVRPDVPDINKVKSFTAELQITNCLFYNTPNIAVAPAIINTKRVFLRNNIFDDSYGDLTSNDKVYNSIRFGEGEFTKNSVNCIFANPKLKNPNLGSFFPMADSPALNKGDPLGLSFDVDGVDFSKYDSLGRTRASSKEVGPYTRYN